MLEGLSEGTTVYADKGYDSKENRQHLEEYRLPDGIRLVCSRGNVQGVMSVSLPSGTAKYAGEVLNFRARNLDEKANWMDAGNSYRTAGSFTADVDDVDFDAETIAGKINSGDNRYMDEQAFTAGISGSSFNGK